MSVVDRYWLLRIMPHPRKAFTSTLQVKYVWPTFWLGLTGFIVEPTFFSTFYLVCHITYTSVGSISIISTLWKIVLFSIVISWPNSKVNTILIKLSYNRKPCIWNILTIAKFYMIISTKMAPKPFAANIKAMILKIELSLLIISIYQTP